MLSEALALSFRNFRNHLVRFFLTTLGIFLGILLIIVTGNAGAAFQQQMINQTVIGGERAIQFSVGSKANLSFHYLPVFTANEVGLIASTPHIIHTAPMNIYFSESQSDTISGTDGKSHVLFSPITATTADYFTINDLGFAQGSAFSDGQPQIVLGATAALQYGLTVGEQISLFLPQVSPSPIACKISGILTLLPTTLFGNSSNLNGLVAISQATLGKSDHYEALNAQVDSVDNLVTAESSIEKQLNVIPELQQALHGSGYEVIGLSQQDNVQAVSQILGGVQAFVIIIAILAAAIGGIGVANTMLLTITERTRQIAVMRAIGATRGQIRLLFITESLLVSLIGTSIGLLLGLVLAPVISLAAGFPVVFAVWPVLVGVALGVIVGACAGFYPANRAATINIREALLYE